MSTPGGGESPEGSCAAAKGASTLIAFTEKVKETKAPTYLRLLERKPKSSCVRDVMCFSGLIRVHRVESTSSFCQLSNVQEDKEETATPDSELRALLAEFPDLFLEELPKELPPRRAINHKK